MSVHVVHLAQRFHPVVGGAETYVREIALEQSRRGHDVTVLTTRPPAGAPQEEMLEVAGGRVRILRFPTRHFRGDYLIPPWLPMKGAEEWLTSAQVDLVHAHAYRFSTVEIGARVCKARNIPFVVSALGFYPPENAAVSLSRAVYDGGRGGRALRQADRCIALTADEIRYHEQLGIRADLVDVIPPGILPDALEQGDGERFRTQHGLKGSVVLFLARLAHDKGLSDLVEAMRDVPDATLAVVGPDAGAREAAQALALKLEIADRVKFLGPVPSTRDAYAACDVFVHPSHYEAFGMVIVEAQAQGKAVITTTSGGCPDAGGAPATLVPPAAPVQLAAAIRALLADPSRRAKLGAAGKARAPRFLWTNVVDKIQETYERAQRR